MYLSHLFHNKFITNLIVIHVCIVIKQCHSHPILIVISFDGFRSDYVNKSLTPVINNLSINGVLGIMKSQFVTKTYPNHQSIATGLYEETHGIINNAFYDPQLKENFDVNDPSPKWWDNGVSLPIWITNQMKDSKERYSGSMMWPGAGARYRNTTIKYNINFLDGQSRQWNDRIDIVMRWITNPSHPANCVFIYFENPDTIAHEYGPWSPQVMEKVKDADETVGYLLKRLKNSCLLNRTNIILLSDHGMAEISPDRVINLDNFLNRSLYNIYGSSPVWSILPKYGHEEKVYTILKNASEHMNFTVYYREEIPLEYHYGNNRRVLPLFIVADEGFDIYQNMTYKPQGKVWGNHGYNNSLPSMRPLFIASGPAFKKQYHHKNVFENIDLYPLMNYVLQLFPIEQFPSNGSLSRVCEMLVPPMPTEVYDSDKRFKCT